MDEYKRPETEVVSLTETQFAASPREYVRRAGPHCCVVVRDDTSGKTSFIMGGGMGGSPVFEDLE